jgi:PTH1 family peptidyl-tRNA hydrolase
MAAGVVSGGCVAGTIRLLAGLGNPGPDYEGTRHNVGFWLADEIARVHGGTFRREAKFHGQVCRVAIGGRDLWLLKPLTFMNRSGESVGALCHYLKVPADELLVAHDELDLPVGTARIKSGGGHAGHNGLRDIVSVLGSSDFLRIRIGIAHPGDRTRVVNYVLGRPSRDDEAAIRAALDEAGACLPLLLEGRLDAAQQRLHTPR